MCVWKGDYQVRCFKISGQEVVNNEQISGHFISRVICDNGHIIGDTLSSSDNWSRDPCFCEMHLMLP